VEKLTARLIEEKRRHPNKEEKKGCGF